MNFDALNPLIAKLKTLSFSIQIFRANRDKYWRKREEVLSRFWVEEDKKNSSWTLTMTDFWFILHTFVLLMISNYTKEARSRDLSG